MSKLNEKRKRFNFIDVILLVVILVIVSVLAFIGFKAYNNYFMKDSTGSVIRYEIVIEGVSNDIKYSINEGDDVIESLSFTSIGKVVGEPEITPTPFVASDDDGKLVESDHPSKSDIRITVEAKANGSKGTYDINGYTLCVGKSVSFRVPGFSAEGICVSAGGKK